MNNARSLQSRDDEHAQAVRLGFYVHHPWWIDAITRNRGDFYKWTVTGWNPHASEAGGLGPRYTWRVPNLSGRFAFTLHEIGGAK